MTARDTTWQEGDVRSGVDSIDKDSSCMAREPALNEPPSEGCTYPYSNIQGIQHIIQAMVKNQ